MTKALIVAEPVGPLRQRLVDEAEMNSLRLGDLTVLAPGNDPYRVDTPAGHKEAAWLVEQLDFIPAGRAIHLRGLHYSIVARGDVGKPNGEIYVNNDANWEWLVAGPAKSARWLGYVPFDRIADNRNAAPELVGRETFVRPFAHLFAGATLELPDPDDFTVRPAAIGLEPRQPYALAIFGEKSSLREALAPLCQEFDADLYLPSGEISDSLLYTMARRGAEDGRPMVLFTLSDADPSGRQMPISIGRKLQALRDLVFPDLEFTVVPVALTAAQAGDLDLPSTPLKDSERRADKWREAFGREQTEIDALEALRPDVLASFVRAAVRPYYDQTLARRVREEEERWGSLARQAIQATIGPELKQIEEEARALSARQRGELEALNARLTAAAKRVNGLPDIRVLHPLTAPAPAGSVLVSSDWRWGDQTAALKGRKSYGRSAGGASE